MNHTSTNLCFFLCEIHFHIISQFYTYQLPSLTPSIAQEDFIYTLSHLENDRDVSAYSGRRRLSSRAKLMFSHRLKKKHLDCSIKDASAACVLGRAQ